MLVVIILALGNGIQAVITKQLQMFGSDWVVAIPGKETNPLISLVAGQRFREKDLMALKNIPGVAFVVPEDSAIMNAEYKGEKKSVLIHANPWSIKEFFNEAQGMRLVQGQWPAREDTREVVLGYGTAEKLFKSKISVGDEIIIKSRRMKVAGITGKIGEQIADNIIYMSLEMYYDISGSARVARAVNVKVSPGTNINLIAQEMKYELSKQEVVKDFTVLTPEKAGTLINNVLSIIELVLIILALISLVVGAVGVMNTMYTSVLERTRDIGVMKAIGASSSAILSLFLIESGIIGMIGGTLGIVLGVVCAYIAGLVAESTGIIGLFSFAALDYFGLLCILIITFITGIVSGLLPALNASRMEPAESLRYE